MTKPSSIRLGVNIDHVATLRNARGQGFPDPVVAALMAQEAGADGITAHLREDRRHIVDADIRTLKAKLSVPLNMEMAATEEMLAIALDVRPNAVCLVPEKRKELTTEGGLDVLGQQEMLTRYVSALKQANIRVSLFIDPVHTQVKAAAELKADIVELHTGTYCEVDEEERASELERLKDAAQLAARSGLECHAGHGLNYDTAAIIAAIPEVVELNIGHFLICDSVFIGLTAAVKRMRTAMHKGRKKVEQF